MSHARSIQDGIASLEIASEMKSQVMSAIADVPEQQRQQVAADSCRDVRGFQTAWTDFSRAAKKMPAENEFTSIVISAAETARDILRNCTILKQWIGWQANQSKARSLGLAPFVDSIKSSEFPTSEVRPGCRGRRFRGHRSIGSHGPRDDRSGAYDRCRASAGSWRGNRGRGHRQSPLWLRFRPWYRR